MRMPADEVVGSEAERRCLDALRQATASNDVPIERHSVRVYLRIPLFEELESARTTA